MMRVTSLHRVSSRRRWLRAFTLLEVLIAAGLFSLVGAILATTLSSSIDAKEIVEDTSDRYHLVRQAMRRMCDEISMAYVSKHQNSAEIVAETGFKGERDALTFTAFGHVPRREDAKQSDQRELSYFLGDDERTGLPSLMRRVQPNPDDDFEEGGRIQTLLPDVVDVTFEYWDQSGEDWEEKWDLESSTTQNRLPTRVRITLVARMQGDQEQTFVTQTRIWLELPLKFDT